MGAQIGPADLASLIGARICHDLISPIGAIGNGIELMGLVPPGNASPEFSLVSDSCTAAQARIRFFRIAFGSHGLSDQTLPASEGGAILTEYAAGGRLRPDWQVAQDMTRRELQIACLAYLCFETAMPRGGTVRIARLGDSWLLQAEDPRLSVDPCLWSGLTGTRRDSTVSPAQVQFVLLPIIAADQGRTIALSHEGARLSLTV